MSFPTLNIFALIIASHLINVAEAFAIPVVKPGWVSSSSSSSSSFANQDTVTTWRTTLLFSYGENHNNHQHSGDPYQNNVRDDVRNLLTQRAIQSFMSLCESVRDPHSIKWMEEFLGAPNQLEYHGTGAGYMQAFGGSWDDPLLAMMQQDKDVVVVSAKRTGKGHKGWSKNNPYLEDRYVEFNIDIDPVSLTNRILSVREQIAKEWESDLEILRQSNDKILESYARLSKEQQQQQQQQQYPPPEPPEPTQPNQDSLDNVNMTPPASTAKTPAFERTAYIAVDGNIAFSATASSPFRKANFDLVCNLCTQTSIHRLLRRLRDDDIGSNRGLNAASFEWLRDFYGNRVAEYFDGNQRYGRADDFLEELLLAAPSIPKGYDGSSTNQMADPMRLAEDIIQIRSEVAEEWKAIMASVPQEHTNGIRKELLDKQMASWGSSTPLGGGTPGTFE